MDTREQISERCLAVCRVPKYISVQTIHQSVKHHRPQTNIVDSDEVPGIESDITLTRWILFLNSAEDVTYMCREVKSEEIQQKGQSCAVTYQQAIACELPERWQNIEVHGSENSQSEPAQVIPTQAASQNQVDKDPHQYPIPHPRQHGDSHQTQPNQRPVGPYGAMSGYYPNIPGSEQLPARDSQEHNQGQMPQGQIPQGHPMYPQQIPHQAQIRAHAPGQPSAPGDTQNHGHYNVPFQGHLQAYAGQQDGSTDCGPGRGQPPNSQPGQNYQFGPMPGQFHPGQQNMPGRQNYFMPMQIFVDPRTGQYVRPPGFPSMHQQPADNRGGPLPSQAQPPPYNSHGHGESTNTSHTDVKSPAHGHDSGSSSQAVADQNEMIQRLESKINKENIEKIGQEEQPQEETDVTEETPAQEETERQTKIVVSNLPASVHEEYLEMFFESTKKFGGGPVFNVDYDEENASAVVEFENPEAVDVVLQKAPIKMMGQTVEVKVFEPEEPTPMCTIEVTGPCSIVCEKQLEMLEMYFDNTKRSGGGDVVECVFDSSNSLALVTFETEEVAQWVEERSNHTLNKERLVVKLHVPAKHSHKSQEPRKDITEDPVPEEPHCTIKVKGVDKSASRDTVEFYFENTRRSGGGELESVKSDSEEEDVIYVTFKNEQVAQNVSKRTHKVEDKPLIVTLHIPPILPPSYENKALIKGLTPSITEDCLFNFIEAKSRCIPESMDYHVEQEGIVMVTFEINPEFDILEKVFGKNKLEGVFLKIYPVPISNCIIVANLAAEVTKDTVEFYFENTRRSGGGAVNKVVMNNDDTCLVYFTDYLVIDEVLQRNHALNGEELDVKRYQECLGRPEGETSERKLRTPDPVMLTNVDMPKIKFMKHSKANRVAIEMQLSHCYTKITWVKEKGDVKLECSLTLTDKDCFRLVKQWKEKAVTNFNDFMKNITVNKVSILQDIWTKVMEDLQNVTIDNPEAVAIFVDQKESTVTAVGNKNVADALSKTIEGIAKKVMADAEIERQKIKDVVTTLKQIETKMLLADKFPIKMEDEFKGLKVKINHSKNEIVFEGPLGQVRDAKLKMYEFKGCFSNACTDKLPTLSVGLYHLKQTKEHIVKRLKTDNVTAVWEVTDGALLVYSTSAGVIQKSLRIIRESVTENSIPLTKASKSVMNCELWQTKIDELHVMHAGKLHIYVSDDTSKVQVCATDDIATDILDGLKRFLRLNTITEVKVTCTKNVHRLIERHHKDQLANISKDLQSSHVQITHIAGYGGFEVRGTEDGIQQVKTKLLALLKRVQQREHILKKPGLAAHMQTVKGKDNLNTIESMLPCVVSVKDYDNDEESVDNPFDSIAADSGVSANLRLKGLKIHASCKVYDCRNIYTVEGDMTDLTVDVLVNPADEKLSLTGGIGKAFVSKGGKRVQLECMDYIKSEGRLGDGEAFVSTAGDLKAKYIVHVMGPVWKGGKDKEDEMLNEAVCKCLQQATTRQAQSVAIPAISCGTYGYPVRHATSTIVEAVKNFFREVQESPITDIYLCDVKLNTVEGFNEALRKEFGLQNVQTYKPIPTPRQDKSSSNADSDDIQPMSSDEEDDDFYITSSNTTRGKGLPKARSAQPSTSGSDVRIGNMCVSVVHGEIAKQKVGVIVNTTAKNLDLKNGAVSASLLKSAGQELQQEVTQKYPSGIQDGEIAVTSGQKLKCDLIIHSSMANWDGGSQCTKALHKLMKDCMTEADKNQVSSIAFPAIGTGNLGFPRDVVATEMFSAVSKFAESNQASSLKDVRFIVYQKDFQTIQAFENELKRWTTGRRGSRLSRKFNTYENLQTDRGQGKDYAADEPIYESVPDANVGGYSIGCITVSVLQGDITSENADAIVNSSNSVLDLSRGAVSKALMKKGGKKLAKELDTLRKDMKRDHIVVTSAPGLRCKHIIHIVACETAQEWQQMVILCLEKAEEHQFNSIAFPALGTGIQMEAAEIAKIMTKAIINFEKSQPKHLNDVRFVIYQQPMVAHFHKAIQNSGICKSKGFIANLKDWFQGNSGQDGDKSSRQVKRKTMEHIDPNKVTFVILAMSGDIIQKAIEKLESCLEKEVHSKKFDDSIIMKMDENQIHEVQTIAKQYHLDLYLAAGKGHIQISGIAANVMSASDRIHRIMRDAVAMEQQKNAASLMINIVQWNYIEIGDTAQTLMPYDQELNYRIEIAYIQKAPNVKFSANHVQYVLDFTKMEEFPEDDDTDVVTVIRRDLVKQAAFEQPLLWADMTGNLRVVVLQSTDKEYQDIEQTFVTSAQLSVVKIERVQNKTLWAQYQAKKKQLEDQNPPNTQNENLLWHGTAVETVDNINAHGFNRSYCGKNATMFGDGVYFAVSAQYSARNTYSRPDASGVKRMYYCRVLTGVYTQGKQGMRVPPNKSGGSNTALYDSVADNANGPVMFIIFHDTQAYPEYLITFK